jgi:hypothetical protein
MNELNGTEVNNSTVVTLVFLPHPSNINRRSYSSVSTVIPVRLPVGSRTSFSQWVDG